MQRPLAACVLAVALFLLAQSGVASAATPVHPRLVFAEKVALGYDLAAGFLRENRGRTTLEVTQADRDALAAVRDMVEDWGRYTIVDRPDQADVLIAVRSGRLGSISFGAPAGGRGAASEISGRSIGLEASSRDDMLSVYDSAGGRVGSLLWRAQQSRGLSDTAPSLFEKLRSDVDAAAKRP